MTITISNIIEALQKVNFYAKHVIANWQKLTVLVKIDIHVNYDYAALNWLLIGKKSSNWGTKIKKQKLKIWKLMHSFYRCMNLCVVLNFDISNVDYF